MPEGTKLDEYEETRVFLINSDGEETKKEVEIENDKINDKRSWSTISEKLKRSGNSMKSK